jgi:xylulokinase
MTLANTTPSHIARAAYEGVLCSLADGLDYVRATGATVERLMLIGGAARSSTLQRLAPSVFGLDITVPEPGEYVAVGAARQAAWVLSGGDEPPPWTAENEPTVHEAGNAGTAHIREQYAAASDLILNRQR